MAAVRKRLLISGQVQGVFFRDSVRREARARGLGGSAANLDDGRVEVILEGDEHAVAEVARWCHSGPPHASVEGVEEETQEPTGDSTFKIH